MRILVLGNGFDLDHGLATSYKDFLNFCNAIASGDYNSKSFCEENLTDEQKRYCRELVNNTEDYTKIYYMLHENHLLSFFTNHSKQDDWTGMETDIALIVDELSQCEDAMNSKHINDYIIESDSMMVEVLRDLNLIDTIGGSPFLKKYQLNSIVKSVLEWLRHIVIVLEYYIDTFINHTEIKFYSPDIIDFNADSIISFNYSDTYERTYASALFRYNCDYIHGIAKSDLDIYRETNVVLGITDELDKPSSFIEVEKFYQRISKRTDNQFKKWLFNKRKNDKASPLEVMFFGHSLDYMDSDILKVLVEEYDSKIIIVYFDNNAYKTILANLVSIFGKEQTIDYINSNDPKIVFRKQKKHTKVSDGGLEILKDIVKARVLYKQDKPTIDALLQKIENKVYQEDIVYFTSQEYLIDLYDALVCQKINVLDSHFETLLEISSKLSVSDEFGYPINHNSNRWIEVGPYGPEDCNIKTLKLIKKINANNVRLSPQNSNKINKLFSNNDPSVKEIKSIIMKVFEMLDCEYNGVLYSRLLSYLVNLYEKDVSTAIYELEEEQNNSLSFCVRMNALKYDYNFEEMLKDQMNNYQNPYED